MRLHFCLVTNALRYFLVPPVRAVARIRYGQRKFKGRPVRHFGEERVITAIQEMHRQGLSLRKIARFLSAIGVPTKRRGKAWHPEISRLLDHSNPSVTMRYVSQTGSQKQKVAEALNSVLMRQPKETQPPQNASPTTPPVPQVEDRPNRPRLSLVYSALPTW